MSQHVSYVDDNIRSDRSVSVIATFDSEGHVKPLYVRMGDASLKVANSWISSSRFDVIEYQCQVEDGEYLKPLTLTYYVRETVWRTPKKPRS